MANRAKLTSPSGVTQASLTTQLTGRVKLISSLDASTNPNYPAASKGEAYNISVAGRVGGGAGKQVDVGDLVLATADSAGGTEAGVGTSWIVAEHNLVGALLAANNLSDVASAATARTNLGVADKYAIFNSFNLKITRDEGGSPNTKVKLQVANISVLANYQAILQDTSSPKTNLRVDQNTTLTVDAGVVGANGLDAGVQAASTWYYIWLIAKADGTVAGLLSTSSTAPTMPADYIYKLLVGAVYSNGSTQFVAFTQIDKEVVIADTVVFTAQAGVTSWTSQSVSTIVPPTAKKLRGTRGVSTTAQAAFAIAGGSAGEGGTTHNGYFDATILNGFYNCSAFEIMMLTAQTFYWLADTTNAWYRATVSGWEY